MNAAAPFVPSLLALALAVAVGGCATDRPPGAPGHGRAMPTTGVTAMQAGAAARSKDRPKLSSGQIVEVVHAANLGEIEQGELARSKTKDPRVKELAARMVKDHTAADAKAIELTKKGSLDLAPTPLSTSLERDAEASTIALKRKLGAELDAAYVDVQVKEHQALLDAIDQKLVPAAKDPDVKAFLDEVRPMIATHLQHAQDLQRAMQEK